MAKIKSVLFVVVSVLLVSAWVPVSRCSKKPLTVARKEDIPYIKCQVCEKLAAQLYHQVQKKQAEISPKKVFFIGFVIWVFHLFIAIRVFEKWVCGFCLFCWIWFRFWCIFCIGDQISEYQIIEMAENVCNLKKAEADWILQIDIVEQGDKLEVRRIYFLGFFWCCLMDWVFEIVFLLGFY